VGLSFTVIFILSINMCIRSGQSVFDHAAVDELAGFCVSGQQFVFVTETVLMFFF
jgi:hypothetical protein